VKHAERRRIRRWKLDWRPERDLARIEPNAIDVLPLDPTGRWAHLDREVIERNDLDHATSDLLTTAQDDGIHRLLGPPSPREQEAQQERGKAESAQRLSR
jgi:hypothetical protein